jgi:hypothetical protein
MKANGGAEVYLQSCVTSALRGDEWSSSRTSRCTPPPPPPRKEPRFALNNCLCGPQSRCGHLTEVRKGILLRNMCELNTKVSSCGRASSHPLLQHLDRRYLLLGTHQAREWRNIYPFLLPACSELQSPYPDHTAVMLTGRLLKFRQVVPSLTTV